MKHLQLKRERIATIVAAALFSLLYVGNVTAAGIQVSPAALKLNIRRNEPAIMHLTVANPTADVQLFRVYPDTMSDNFTISPASFTLESGAHRDVSVRFTNADRLSQIIQTNISVTARPLVDNRFTTATGVKVPFTATVEARQSVRFMALPPALLAALLGATLMAGAVLLPYLLKRLRKKESSQDQH